MRVALVASRYAPHPGALERHAHELAQGLARRGATVEVLTQEYHGETSSVSELDGVLVRRFWMSRPSSRVSVAPGLSWHLHGHARSFDLVHALCAPMPLAMAVLRASPRRLVFSPLSSIERMLSWPYARATRAVLDRVGQTLCRSRADADLLSRAFPAAVDRLQVVPDGIDAPEIRAAKPFTTSASVVLAVGRLERRKHVERAIATMASLPPAYQLVVVGDGPARRGLRAHAADLQVSPRVHFAGQVSDSDLHRWLRTARVVLALAEEAGGSGLQVLEAIAAGVPVVASDIPAHREAASYTAGEGVTFVSPEGSPLEVADAIAQAATGPAPVIARSLPSWDDALDATLAVYEQILDEPVAGGMRADPLGNLGVVTGGRSGA